MEESDTSPPQEKRRPPFAITLPTFTFSVAAFAEAWEYDDEDEDDVIEEEYADLVDDRRQTSTLSRAAPGRGGKAKTVGVLEKKANTTYIGGEVVIGKEAEGDLKV
jgi:dynactin-4